MRAEVLGIGWVTAAGMGRGRQAAPFALCPGELPPVARKDIFAEPDLRFGRLDGFSRLGLAAIALALQDAGLDAWTEKRPVALAAASRYGCLTTDADYFDTVLPQQGRLASPNLFAYTLPNCFLGEAAIRFGLTGPACDPQRAGAGRPDAAAAGPGDSRLGGGADGGGRDLRPAAAAVPRARPGPSRGRSFSSSAQPARRTGYGEISLAAEGNLCAGGERVPDLEVLVNRLRNK